jgi:hypothetical protein
MEGSVNESEFEAQLKGDGYQEIEKQTLDSRPGKGRHRHFFAIRGLVLSGTFLVTQTGGPVTYGPGQIFTVDHGEQIFTQASGTASALRQKSLCWRVPS